MSTPSLAAQRSASALIALATSAMTALVAILVARPLVTDDLWWSIVLGGRFLSSGPWLDADPMLFDAAGPPDPAAWLFDALLYLVGMGAGFNGLRGLHVLLVVLIFTAAWRLLRAAGIDRTFTLIALQIFIVLAAYRLCQLRAQLVSILFVLLLVEALIRRRESSLTWTLLIAAFQAYWANLHAGFVLGPYILGLGVLDSATGMLLAKGRDRTDRQLEFRQRVRILLFSSLASLANPLTTTAYLRPFASGSTAPDLTVIADEWAPFHPFSIPQGNLPPSLLSWIVTWLLLLLLGLATLYALSRARTKSSESSRAWSTPAVPSLFVLAWGLLPMAFVAVRFLWLGIIACLPIFLLASRRSAPSPAVSAPRNRWPAAIVSAMLAMGFVRVGAWPTLAPGTPLTPDAYSAPYSTHKYHAHAIWLLADSGVAGRALTHYFLSSFLGFWTSPDIQTFINGSMNVPAERVQDYVRIVRSYPRGMGPDEFTILEDYEVDLFVGTGFPIAQDPSTPWRYTTTQLEGAADWLLVFRSARSSVLLRRNASNVDNLTRLAAYYDQAGIPFDPSVGFDVGQILDQDPDWAFLHGLIPNDYRRLVVSSTYGTQVPRLRAQRRLGLVYAVLGLYDRAAALESRILAENHDDQVAMRRLAWSLARMQRRSELQAVLDRMEVHPALDDHSRWVRALLQRGLQTGALARLASMPLLARHETAELTVGYLPPATRYDFPAGSVTRR